MNSYLAGKQVVITGASSGIGEQIARKVAESGGNPILLARSTDKLSHLSESLNAHYGVKSAFYSLDLSQMDQIQEVFAAILKEAGRVDVLVNNAGFGIFDFIEEVKLEDIKQMFEVNVIGLMACTKLILPQMLKQGDGHLINIASIAGKIATPKSTIYSATKHAVLGFTNGVRMELAGTPIYVTAVNPGPIQTQFFNIADPKGDYRAKVSRFMLEPEKVAEKIVQVMGKPKREINLPVPMAIGAKFYQVFPNLSEWIAGRWFKLK